MNKGFNRMILLDFLAVVPNVTPFQGGARPAPPSTSNTTPAKPTRRRIPVTRRGGTTPSDATKLANIAIKVNPDDSVIWLNDQRVSESRSNGNNLLTNLKPGTYVLTIRHTGYADQVKPIELKPGTNEPISIDLEPLKGTLVVKPNIDGTSIEVRSISENQSLGSYVGTIDAIDFPPGEYELIVSKPGYKPRNRTVTIKAGALVELEPAIEPLPTTTTNPQVVVPVRSSVSLDGKDLLVRLLGTSGDTTRTAGTMNITVSRTSSTVDVQGSLNGAPCEVIFVPLQNIHNRVLTDQPTDSNNWSLIGARIRPEDPKRAVRFAINWATTQNSADPSTQSQRKAAVTSEVTTKAVVIHRVVPQVPALARSSHITGLVKVSVVVDERGNVKSAKAFDGPMMLRQVAENAARGWKFKPATRNGEPSQSTEVLYFNFER
jgi:TonB family protein